MEAHGPADTVLRAVQPSETRPQLPGSFRAAAGVACRQNPRLWQRSGPGVSHIT
jgi:hypothetical protein